MATVTNEDRLFFDRLTERHRLTGRLITRTTLHIGGGQAHWESASDLPILRDAQNRPFVPGSSIKGVVRSTIESLVRGAAGEGSNPALRACDPLSEKPCGWHEPGGRKDAMQEIARTHCAVCRIFGSHLLASHVRISDALLQEQSRARIELRDGVAIDRDLRTVYGGQKYDFEVVAPGAAFDLEVFVDNPEDWVMGLLLMGFEQLNQGFTALGGFGSRGLGRVAVEWTELSTCTAKALLDGQEPVVRGPAELKGPFDSWRSALSSWSKGEG